MSRARVEALGLLRRDVRELRHPRLRCVVSCACLVRRLALWLLPTCRRWTGCPYVLDRVRGRAGAAVSWSPHEALPAEGAAGASRTAFALHVGQPVKRASGILA